MVERVLAKDEVGVRFPVSAQNMSNSLEKENGPNTPTVGEIMSRAHLLEAVAVVSLVPIPRDADWNLSGARALGTGSTTNSPLSTRELLVLSCVYATG